MTYWVFLERSRSSITNSYLGPSALGEKARKEWSLLLVGKKSTLSPNLKLRRRRLLSPRSNERKEEGGEGRVHTR